jgi:hypothetical protein
LAKHVNRVCVFGRKGNNDVRVLHRRLYEIIVRWFNEAAVLLEHVDNSAPAFRNVATDAASQTNVIRSKYEYFEVHEFAESIFDNGMDSFKHYNWGGLNSLRYVCPLVRCKVVCGNLNVVSTQKLSNFLVSQVEIESAWVVKVVVGCIFVLVFPKAD